MELIEDLRRKMKNKLKTLLPPILTLFTLLAIIGCYTALKPSTQQNDVLYSLKNSSDLKFHTLNYTTFPILYQTIGQASSKKIEKVLAPSAGEIFTVNKAVGDCIEEGTVLATIDNRSLITYYQRAVKFLREATEQHAHSEEKFQELKLLFTNNEVTFDHVKAAESLFNESKRKVEAIALKAEKAKANVDNTSITAPISGFISEVYAREGEIAWPGKELFTIVDNSDLYIKVSIPKHIASLITINNSIAIAFKELESDVQGIVSEISKCDADGSEDYTITIELPKNKGLKVNMVGTIKTKLTERKTILIPKEFIFYTNEEPFVCTIKKGEFIKYKVKLGRAYDDLQEIYSDLLPGSTICRN